jgi:hypothetical protein
MHHLIAKTKGRNGEYLKVFSDDNIFDEPADLNNAYYYTPEYKLEEDEWFCIDDFQSKPFCPDFLKTPFNSPDYNQIQRAQYSQIDHLCSVQDEKYFFQKIPSANILRKKYFTLSNAPVLVQNQPIIILNNEPDALYDKAIDRLYFGNLTAISIIFKGISILFREATEDETHRFLKHRFIALENGYSVKDVKTMNRKRIAMADEIWISLSKQGKQQMTTYIRGYCPKLPFNATSHKFSLTSEEDLRSLLYGILERYYTTNGGEKRLANSIKKL